MKHVPYKGAAPALNDLLAGQIQVVFTSLPSVAGHIKAGTLRGLAVTSARRSPAFRDIPTFAEAGYPALQHQRLVRHLRARRHAGGGGAADQRRHQRGAGREGHHR